MLVSAVPFKLSLYEGLGESHGLIRRDGDVLILQYSVKDSLVGVLRSKVRQHEIPLESVASIRLRKGIVRASICLEVLDLTVAEQFPGKRANQFVLPIPWKSRKDAEAFVFQVDADRMDERLRRSYE